MIVNALSPKPDAQNSAQFLVQSHLSQPNGVFSSSMPRPAYVYILANWKRATYIGVTTNLPRRIEWHLSGASGGFASKYRLRRLVHVEVLPTPIEGIRREKELKAWRRERKLALIEATNPGWRDLVAEWGWRGPLDSASG